MQKIKKELEALTQAIRIYNQDIGMEFIIERYTMLIMKSGQRQVMEGIKLPNQEKNQNARRKRKLQVLTNIANGHHQTNGDKRKKEYFRRRKKVS